MSVSVSESVDEIPHETKIFGNVLLCLQRFHQSVRKLFLETEGTGQLLIQTRKKLYSDQGTLSDPRLMRPSISLQDLLKVRLTKAKILFAL